MHMQTEIEGIHLRGMAGETEIGNRTIRMKMRGNMRINLDMKGGVIDKRTGERKG